MKSILKAVALMTTVLSLCALIGCSWGGGAAETAGSSAVPVVQTLYAQLGGADGVTMLANQFGTNIAVNPSLNSMLDVTAIADIRSGLINDIMRVSGMAPANAITLESALTNKGLDANGLTALSNSLAEAGRSLGLDAVVMNWLNSSVMAPVSKSVFGM